MRARRHTCLGDLLYLVERRRGALITRTSTSHVCACVCMTVAQKAGEKLEASFPQGTQVHPESESTSTSVCVHTYARTHVHMYAHVHTRVQVHCVRVCVPICAHVCVRVCVHEYMCACARVRVRTCTRVCVRVSHTCACMHKCVWVYCACVYTGACMGMDVYMCAYVRTHVLSVYCVCV